MKKISKFCKLLTIAICILFLFLSNINATKIKKEPDQITVSYFADIIIPDDYNTIQEGINNANPNQIIFVRSGLYKENLMIDIENLTLIGEDKSDTIIDGGKFFKKHTVEIISENVNIKKFTIKNGWNKDERIWDLSGIKINASNARITDNIITENRLGISTMTKTYNHTIKNNTFIDDGLMIGNYVYNYQMSIHDFRHNIDNNTVNDKKMYYLCDKSNYIIPEDAGQIILVNCTNITVKNLNFEDTDFFISLAGCKNCNITNNKVDDTDGELILFFSENNTIQKNTISNSLHAICLDYNSKNNIVRSNDVFNNWIGISSITGSKNNKIYSNKIYKNKIGIEITTYYLQMKSKSHEIFQNQIYKNNKGVLITANSENLSINNNTIYRNLQGINIKKSGNNKIKENKFINNFISAIFSNCKNNIWNNNYWDRPRFLPKIIFGIRTDGFLPLPLINIDKNPSRKK